MEETIFHPYKFFGNKERNNRFYPFYFNIKSGGQICYWARGFGQCFENSFFPLEKFPLFDTRIVLLQTYIALSAIVFVLLSEIAKQHSAPAFIFGRGIFYHGLDANCIAFFAVFVYITSELDTVLFPAFRVYILYKVSSCEECSEARVVG